MARSSMGRGAYRRCIGMMYRGDVSAIVDSGCPDVNRLVTGATRGRAASPVARRAGAAARRRRRGGLPFRPHEVRARRHPWCERRPRRVPSTTGCCASRSSPTIRKKRLAQHEVCDAHPELVRAAREVGESTKLDCPICEDDKVVLVTYVFGPNLPAFGRCISTKGELAKLDRRAEQLAAYVVEVCPSCSWNHLARVLPVGGRGLPVTARGPRACLRQPLVAAVAAGTGRGPSGWAAAGAGAAKRPGRGPVSRLPRRPRSGRDPTPSHAPRPLPRPEGAVPHAVAPGGSPSRRPPVPSTKRSFLWRWRRGLFLVGLLLVAFVAGTGFVLAQIELPPARFQAQTTFICAAEVTPDGLQPRTTPWPVSTTSRTGSTSPSRRCPRSSSHAVLAAEDRDFFEHRGVDPIGIARAAWQDIRGGGVSQGGSTITQQYVKTVYLSNERTITRKIKEAVLAIKLEQELSKEEILERYLNAIYFGRGAYGVGTAARAYFGHGRQQVDLGRGGLPRRADPGARGRPTPPATPRRRRAGGAPCSTPCSRRATSTRPPSTRPTPSRGSSGEHDPAPGPTARASTCAGAREHRHRVLRRVRPAPAARARLHRERDLRRRPPRVHDASTTGRSRRRGTPCVHPRPAGRSRGRPRRRRQRRPRAGDGRRARLRRPTSSTTRPDPAASAGSRARR